MRVYAIFIGIICTYKKNIVSLQPLLGKETESDNVFISRESVAQQVEHIPFKDGVLGSSPSWFTSSGQSLLFLSPTIKLDCKGTKKKGYMQEMKKEIQ